MPNDQPRRLSPTTPGTQPPKANKESVAPVLKNDKPAIKNTVGLDTISLRKWEVDPLKIAQQLFADKEITKDERTSGLVRPERPEQSGPTGPG